ncbi:Uma2 family endonuclease [Alkalinema sp. FACHB-956]|uniref:Uma2 family endonuclease n=1 Tax=Alkalinema sp. FACHB-956 TaxID=2692768 RepID=UPI0016868BD8|nr:Uma2 family endonuclease [Alkalinema sp. FACHB-956]MBD2327428.1 Uma2 family endonuclease [Alkalinema sp. FACHB-956]
MVTQLTKPDEIFYPESDGEPLANSTIQFDWIVLIKENLEIFYRNQNDVFIAGDLFWYPVEGDPTIRCAPDVLVVLGRPKHSRKSYKQWEEGQIPPQIIFEILSDSNTSDEMDRKLRFYDRYGVEEYYVYDPRVATLQIFLRGQRGLEPVTIGSDWVSPRLQIRFCLTEDDLELYQPNGERFLNPVELRELAEQERQRAESEKQRAESEKQRAESEKQRAESEKQRADRAEAQLIQAVLKLAELGLSPEQIATTLALEVETVAGIVG